MDLIRELIKTIVVIVLLAVFIEMILPKGDMRRYVKMVMGLLIILAVVQTAAGALNLTLKEIPQLKTGGKDAPPLDDIMAAGKKLSEMNQGEAVEQYKQGIASQVLTMARLNPGVNASEAAVSLGGELNDIKDITIYFESNNKKKQTNNQGDNNINVEPVVVDAIGNGETAGRGNSRVQVSPEEKKAAEEVAGAVAQFYNLQPGQVRLEFR